MKEPREIFLICPVRNVPPETLEKIKKYVANLEKDGCDIYWPYRDTNQVDPSGGLEICRTNFDKIMHAKEIHIWYDETSGGSKFDMGGVFMLVEMLGWNKKIVIANESEIIDNAPKSFFKVFQHLSRFKHRPKKRKLTGRGGDKK